MTCLVHIYPVIEQLSALCNQLDNIHSKHCTVIYIKINFKSVPKQNTMADIIQAGLLQTIDIKVLKHVSV